MHIEEHRGGLTLATDALRMDVAVIHRFLEEGSYWAQRIPLEVVARSLSHSLCFGVFDGEEQVAFARVISDHATYAYLCDVFVLEPYRGQGVGRWMMEAIGRHPALQGLRRWGLVTRDAHGLYAQFGYVPVARPEDYMERVVPHPYGRPQAEEN